VSNAIASTLPNEGAILPPATEYFVGFGRLLRHYGYHLALEQVMAFLESVILLGPRSMEDIHAAAYATLAPSPDRRDEFETLFRNYFFGDVAARAQADDQDEMRVKDDDGGRRDQRTNVRQEKGGAIQSSSERLNTRNFEVSQGNQALLRFQRLLTASLPMRRSFRTVESSSRGHVDLRRSLRTIVRADGDVPRPLLRRRQLVTRKILLLIDISGSMKLHTTDYLKIAHAIAQATDRAEIFAFGTRLTRITPALRVHDRGRALAGAARRVDDWDGGTRIGPTLLAFLSSPRYSAFARGAAIVILSDALERGDSAAIETAMRRLGARAFRLSLCTPLAGDPRFRPETAALRAILPALDDLVDGSSVAELIKFILSLGHPAPRAEAVWRRLQDAKRD
jgi:uncharacterized protein